MTRTLFTLIKQHPQTVQDDHDRAFIVRYEALLAYARRLVGTEWALADDLIQDAYVQFTIARPDLAHIETLDAYLATLVRNLHVSCARRTTAHRSTKVALYDYDSAALALESTIEEQFRVRDALMRICAFACARKDVSKAASVLLLRFFHDFLPSEVAQILRSTPQAVNSWLWQARREVRVWLDDPGRLVVAHIHGAQGPEFPTTWDDSQETIALLRAAIFSTQRPPCITPRAIARWDTGGSAQTLDVGTFAHIASCRDCLGRISHKLGLASVHDELPPDPGPGGINSSTSGMHEQAFQKRARRRARAIGEHRPKQLHVSVNGHQVGLICVESAHNEVRWSIRQDEPVAFAELHSEQGVRMALLHIELPPVGDLRQRVRVPLSDDRHLILAMDFSELHPSITVEYVDPSLASVSTVFSDASDAAPIAHDIEPNTGAAERGTRQARSIWSGLRGWWRRPHHLVPATTLLTVVVAAAWWMYPRQPGIPDAVTLIERAVVSEVNATPVSHAVHRTLQFQMRRADASTATLTYRIDAWTRPDTSVRAVRVFDPTGHLVAGHWRSEGGEDTIELGLLDDVWQADLSAAAFRDGYMSIGSCATSAAPATYTITCAHAATTSLLQAIYPAVLAQTPATRPRRASLVLQRPDLRVLRLELMVPVAGVEQIVTIEEQAVARAPVADIPVDTFTPETRRRSDAAPADTGGHGVVAIATPSLEVRLVELVDRLAAGEYLSVRRTAANGLSVTGLLSTDRQKRELITAISDLNVKGLIATDVLTYEEAAERERRALGHRTAESTSLRLLESGVTIAPVDEYVRARVPPGSDATTVVRELTPRVLALSERIRRHSLALKAFVDRFDNLTVASLDDEGKRAWQGLLSRHSLDCLAALDALDAALAPYFDGREDSSLPADTLDAVSRRLANEATTIDEAITAAFSASNPAVNESKVQSIRDVRQHIHRARLDARAIQHLAQS